MYVTNVPSAAVGHSRSNISKALYLNKILSIEHVPSLIPGTLNSYKSTHGHVNMQQHTTRLTHNLLHTFGIATKNSYRSDYERPHLTSPSLHGRDIRSPFETKARTDDTVSPIHY